MGAGSTARRRWRWQTAAFSVEGVLGPREKGRTWCSSGVLGSLGQSFSNPNGHLRGLRAVLNAEGGRESAGAGVRPSYPLETRKTPAGGRKGGPKRGRGDSRFGSADQRQRRGRAARGRECGSAAQARSRRPPSRGAWRGVGAGGCAGRRALARGEVLLSRLLSAPPDTGLGISRGGVVHPAASVCWGWAARWRRPLSFRFASLGQASGKHRTAARALAEKSRPKPPRGAADSWTWEWCGQLAGASPERAETGTPGAKAPQCWAARKARGCRSGRPSFPWAVSSPRDLKAQLVAGGRGRRRSQTFLAGSGVWESYTILHQPAT